MKKLFFVMVLSAATYTLCINWPWQKKNQPAAQGGARQDSAPQLAMLQKEINKLINDKERLKKELKQLSDKAGLNGDATRELLKDIDQGVDYQDVANTLKSIDAIEDKKDDEITELKKQVEDLGMSLYNVLKTFEANINAAEFSKVLKENLETLDSKESVKRVTEAMANVLYRLKFMYTEASYLLKWTNSKINWQAAQSKGINRPDFTKDFTDDQIKQMVMAVKVD